MEKLVYKLTENDATIVKNHGWYPVATDKRIGFYFLASILDATELVELKNKLSVTEKFPLRDLEDDVDNTIVLLPSELCFKLKSLFNRVYLVCDNEEIAIKVNESTSSGVKTNVKVLFTPVEIMEIDNSSSNIINFNGVDYVGDAAVFNAIITYWNTENPQRQINFNPIFKNRLKFEEAKNNGFIS